VLIVTDVTSSIPSEGEQDSPASHIAAGEQGDDDGPPTIEMPVLELGPKPELPQSSAEDQLIAAMAAVDQLIAAVASDDQPVLADEAASAAEPSGSDPAPSRVRRRATLVCLGGVIAGIMIVGTTYLVTDAAAPSAATASLPDGALQQLDAASPTAAPDLPASVKPWPPARGGEPAEAPDAPPRRRGAEMSYDPPSRPPAAPPGTAPGGAVPPPRVWQLPPPPPVAPQPAELKATYSTIARQGRAKYRGEVIVSNVSRTTAANWRVAITLDARGQVFGAAAGIDFRQDGTTVTFSPREQVRRIGPGEFVRFTFDVRKSKLSEPANCLINDRPCETTDRMSFDSRGSRTHFHRCTGLPAGSAANYYCSYRYRHYSPRPWAKGASS
jgi:hypothetical protein